MPPPHPPALPAYPDPAPPSPPSPLPPPSPAASLQGLPCKGRCRRRRRRGAAPRPAHTLPARRTRSPATYLHRARCFASPRRQTSRQTVAYPSVPVPGHNVGRAFTPAAAPLRHHTPPQTSKASPARGGAAAGGGGVPHLALPISFRGAALPRSPHPPHTLPAAKQKPRPGFSPDRDLRVSFSVVSAAAPAWFAAFYRVTPRRPAPAG